MIGTDYNHICWDNLQENLPLQPLDHVPLVWLFCSGATTMVGDISATRNWNAIQKTAFWEVRQMAVLRANRRSDLQGGSSAPMASHFSGMPTTKPSDRE
jgi:hypothetical protein